MKKKHIAITVFLSIFFIQTNSAQQPVLTSNLGHSGRLVGIAYSPDGKYIVSGSEDKTLKLWDVQSGNEIRSFNGHTEWVSAVAYCPSGRYIASGSGDGSIKVWDILNGKEVFSFTGHKNYVRSLAYSPDGNYLVSVGFTEKNLKLWNARNGQEVYSIALGSVLLNHAIFSPDGKYTLSNESKLLKLRDIHTGQEIRSFKGHNDNVCALAISADSKFIVSGSYDDMMKLWDTQTGQEIRTFSIHKGRILSLAFSPDGKYVVSGGWDNTVYLWDTQTGQEVYKFSGHTDNVSCVVFSPDGKHIASGSMDMTIKLWDLQDRKDIRSFSRHTKQVNTIAFSPDGRGLVSGKDDGKLKYWNIKNGQEIRNFVGHTNAVTSIAISNDSKYIVSASRDQTLKLWDTQTTSEIRSFTKHSDWVLSVSFSPDGKYIASSGGEELILWSPQSGRVIRRFSGHRNRISCIAFSPDSKLMVSGSDDQTLKLWNTSSSKEMNNFDKYVKHRRPVNSVAFSLDGKYIVSGSDDMTLILWNVQNGQAIYRFSEQNYKVNSVAFSPDGKTIVSGNSDHSLSIWNTQTGQKIADFTGHTQSVVSVAFSPDGKFIASGSEDGTIKIWDPKMNRLLVTLVELKDTKEWIVYTPDGRFDGTPGGMKLLYFVKGIDIIPLESMFEQYYTPKLLAKVMEGEILPAPAVTIDNLTLPPLVKIISPNTDVRGFIPVNNMLESEKQTVDVTVEVTDQGGGIDEIVLFHNGKLVNTTNRGFIPVVRDQSKTTRTFHITLVNGENHIRASAFNQQRTEAIPQEIVLRYASTVQIRPNIYILAIGINDYQNPRYNLNYAKNDADAFVKAIQSGASGIFDKVVVSLLFDARATRAGIMAEIDKLKAQVRQEDVFIFYYAGHGAMSSGNEREKPDFYLIPHDVTRIYEADEMLKSKGISAKEIGDFSKSIPSQKQLFVLDACHSGGAMQTFAMRGAAEEKAIAQLSRSTGTYFIAASGTEQFATEVATLGHGIFTYSILQALKGACKANDGRLTVNLLKGCVEELVPELSKQHKGSPQYPTGYGFGQDFPIGIVR